MSVACGSSQPYAARRPPGPNRTRLRGSGPNRRSVEFICLTLKNNREGGFIVSPWLPTVESPGWGEFVVFFVARDHLPPKLTGNFHRRRHCRPDIGMMRRHRRPLFPGHLCAPARRVRMRRPQLAMTATVRISPLPPWPGNRPPTRRGRATL